MRTRSSVWHVPAAFLAIAVAAVAIHDLRLLPDGKLHVHILDVGQGSAALIVSPSGRRVLIDGGPDLLGLERLGAMMPVTDRSIDMVILSHPDADHIGMLPDVLRRYDVRGVMLAGVEKSAPRYELVLRTIEEENIDVLLPDPARDIDLGDGAILDIVWPERSVFGAEPVNVNDASVVVRAMFASRAVLLPGDIEERAERAILRSGARLRSDVLVVPHHGSKTSSSTGFLLAVRPSSAVISLGADNPFGHPHAEVLDRLRTFGIPVRRTDEEGTIELVIDAIERD